MKYVIYNGHAMTPKQLNKNPIRPFKNVVPYHKHHTDEEESTTPVELSEDSISDTPAEASEDSKPIERPRTPMVIIKSTHDDADSSRTKPISEFELPKENGEQIIVLLQENKLLTTDYTVEIQNQKVEGLITYFVDQQFSNSRLPMDTKNPKKPLILINFLT